MVDKIWKGISSVLNGTLLFPKNLKTTIFVGYHLFCTDLNAGLVNGFAWGTAVLVKLQDEFTQLTFSKGAV